MDTPQDTSQPLHTARADTDAPIALLHEGELCIEEKSFLFLPTWKTGTCKLTRSGLSFFDKTKNQTVIYDLDCMIVRRGLGVTTRGRDVRGAHAVAGLGKSLLIQGIIHMGYSSQNTKIPKYREA